MKRIIALSIIMLLFSNLVMAQNSPKLPSLFHKLHGTWSMVINEIGQDGQWKSNSASEVTFSGLLNQQFLVEDAVHYNSLGTVHMHVIFGIDPRNGEYRTFALDKEYGTMDVYRGKFENNKLVVDNLKDLGFKMENGQKLNFRLSYDLSAADRISLFVELSTDQGSTWNPFQKIEYNRKS